MATHSLSSRQSTFPSSTSSLSSTQSSILQQRISQKRAELESLLALRDLSSQLATQIENLGDKLSTLDTGFETVAEVMGNWGSILSVLGMVGSSLNAAGQARDGNATNGADASAGQSERPQTLVRIPVDVSKDAVEELRGQLEGTALSGAGNGP